MTYNAQQQYFKEGPGTCFNPKHFNSNNSSCSSNSNSTSNNSTSNITNDSNINTDKKIQDLENKINCLIKEIEKTREIF